MRLLGKLAIAVLISASPAVAKAADLMTVSTSGNDSLPVADAGFNWNGFYAGVYGVARTSPVGGTQYGLGLDVGADARFEFILVGAEVAYHGLAGGNGSTSYLEATGKAGILATDNLALYGVGGVGTDLGPPDEADALLGGGVELAVSDNVTLDARYVHAVPITGANPKDQVKFGANFHF